MTNWCTNCFSRCSERDVLIVYYYCICFSLDREKGYVQYDHFFTSLDEDEPVTENLLCSISPYVGVKWKRVVRKLSIEEAMIRNLDEDYKNAAVAEKCYQGLLA